MTTIFIDKEGKIYKPSTNNIKIRYRNEDWKPVLIKGKGRFKLYDRKELRDEDNKS